MQKYFVSTAGLFAAVLLTGCTQAAAPPPEPVDMRVADQAAISTLERELLKGFETKDASTVASFYAEDGSVLMPNMMIAMGRDHAKDMYAGMFADPNFSLTFDSTKIEVARSSDLAYSQGTYTMAMTDAHMKGNVTTEKGKFVTVYKKQGDGTWKIVSDIVNADAPATSAKPNLIPPRS